ncbi:MAG: hypothetical protein ACI8WB_002355 [Phenylobacterium sp.]|jgi:hypothetical protein
MAEPFTPDIDEIAGSMGITRYQRFTPMEASLFLRCPLAELEKIKAKNKISINIKQRKSS